MTPKDSYTAFEKIKRIESRLRNSDKKMKLIMILLTVSISLSIIRVGLEMYHIHTLKATFATSPTTFRGTDVSTD